MNARKLFCLILLFILSTNLLEARVKYTNEMKSYIGIWTRTDKFGNISAYRISVNDGWVIIRYKFEEHYHDGTEWEGQANEKYTVDYTYQNGKFYFTKNYPKVSTYNSMVLELKEGSLVETTYQTTRNDNGIDNTRSWTATYELDF